LGRYENGIEWDGIGMWMCNVLVIILTDMERFMEWIHCPDKEIEG
jgi:hypothetical protein